MIYNINKYKMEWKDIDYRDIIFNKCERCKDNQLWDERTLENYMRLKRVIDKWDNEIMS